MGVTVKCQQCNDSFEVIKSRAEKARFCSLKCKSEAQAKRYAESRITKTCPACGEEYSFPKCHEGRRRFCSTGCSDANKEYRGPKGDTHHLWQGGIARHSEGYVYELCNGHPYTSLNHYVFQHRLVVERRMRREAPGHAFLVDINSNKYLRPEIDVHHLNEVKDDNSEGNLIACTASGHHAFHHGIKVSPDQYWPHTVKPNKQHGTRIHKVCAKCHKEFQVPHNRRDTAVYCSRECHDNRAKL